MKRGHAMSKSFREGLIAMLEEYRQAPPERQGKSNSRESGNIKPCTLS